MDATCVLRLGGVFGSVITGNLVLLGSSVRAAASVVAAPGVALVGYAVGVLAAAPIAREHERDQDRSELGWPWRVIICLGIECAVLAAFSAGWLAAGARPGTGAGLALLGAAAAAMGIQSAAIRRLGELSTTYLTGTLTGLLAALAVRRPPARPWRGAGILVAVIAGAAGAAVTISLAPALIPLVVLAPLTAVLVAAVLLRRRLATSGSATVL